MKRKPEFFWLSVCSVSLSLAALVLVLLPGKDSQAAQPLLVRVGYMPNVTHAQAVIARANGWFEQRLEKDLQIKWQAFHAGPSIIEGVFSGQIDIAYIGPGPAINGYIKSGGEALRVIAGSACGGAAFVVREGSGIQSEKDLAGKRIATPQLGNTQDIALRAWLMQQGLKPKEKGGTVQVLPVANPDQITLFRKGQLDGAWTVEPWVSRLEQEGNGRILFEEASLWKESKGKYATTLLIVRKKFLDEHPQVVSQWVRAHVELTTWVSAKRAEVMSVFNAEIAKETGKPLPEKVLQSAFDRLEFTIDPVAHSIKVDADMAYELGFLGKQKPDIKGLLYLSLLEEAAQIAHDIMARPGWWT